MRHSAVLLIAIFLLRAGTAAQNTPVCVNLCLQQLPAGSCPSGQTTSISGVVYAPNGTDPLPNVTVYIPNDVVPAFTPGVQCPIAGAPPSGSPLVGATTAVDGSFTIANVPVGVNIPLVIVSGRWRRQIVIPLTTACANTVLSPAQTHLPRNRSEGDIPLFAIATGSADSVECALRKVGIDDAEFTDPAPLGNGRIQIFSGSDSPGSRIDANTPSQAQLMANLGQLESYDVLMLPCQGDEYAQTAAAESNFDSFVNSGGRVYASHFSYVWMDYAGYTNGPFAGVANWAPGADSIIAPDPGTATINQNFGGGITLAQWLQQPAIAATTIPGQITLSTLKSDQTGVIAPTESWMTLNSPAYGNPVMQLVFNTPIGAANQCGRVLYNEYHVENPTIPNANKIFPAECVPGQPATPQEKLLEYMLFELTDQGGAVTLAPATQDFGSSPVGFPTATKSFILTNNSTFPLNAQIAVTTGFTVVSSNCARLAGGSSCTVTVSFTPTMVGPQTGTLSAAAGATSLLANLTGAGTPDLAFSLPSLAFPNIEVGKTSTQLFTLTNTAPGPVGVLTPVITSTPSGNFSFTTNCPSGGSKLAAGASCTLAVLFQPSTSGPITGTLAVPGTPAPATLIGDGTDFTIAASPANGNVLAGNTISFPVLTSPLAGFSGAVTLSCSTSVPGSTCSLATATNISLSSPVTSTVVITTTSEYAIVGYTAGFRGMLSLLVLASAAFLLLARRRAGVLALLFTFAVAITGCSGKLPARNPIYTAPGTYAYTVTASDGVLTHSTNFTLTVTAK